MISPGKTRWLTVRSYAGMTTAQLLFTLGFFCHPFSISRDGLCIRWWVIPGFILGMALIGWSIFADEKLCELKDLKAAATRG